MTSARYIVADVFEGVASLPDDSVDLVLSSPPFLALRSYLPATHPDKGKEIGSEPTPADFIDTLLDVVEACDRVLAPHGSLVFELGDTYAGSGGFGGDYNPGGIREGQEKFEGSGYTARQDTKYAKVQRDDMPGGGITNLHGKIQGGGDGWPLAKSLTGIPTLFAWSLAYGRNLLRPERTTEPWRIRNVVAWVRPNPPVGALGDKFRPATSYLTVATKARDRYFDLDAVRTPLAEHTARYNGGARPTHGDHSLDPHRKEYAEGMRSNEAGAPPLDWWEIPTQPYKGSHYATWPEALCVKPILAMSPEKVCRVCGEPSRRIVESSGDSYRAQRSDAQDGDRLGVDGTGKRHTLTAQVTTLGWTDCGHGSYRRGCVLDPFAGSGTTLQVATGHGRDAVGIDIDESNADLARERVGMWLSVEHLEAVAS